MIGNQHEEYPGNARTLELEMRTELEAWLEEFLEGVVTETDEDAYTIEHVLQHYYIRLEPVETEVN